MSNDLMIPDAGSVPAHIRNAELAKRANEDAATGISTGAPPRIKVSAKQFKLVDGNGEEKSYPPASMIPGPDGNTYMPVIVLRAKRALNKTWYASKYNPAEETEAPDCFSEDAVKPHSTIKKPQSDSCETCGCNAFGSGTDQEGNATAGKACADTKILAVFVPNHGVHSLKIPPGSLKNFGLFVKKLSGSGIPVGSIKTFVGFDMNCEYPKLDFQFGGFLEEAVMPKVEELRKSDEVNDIVGDFGLMAIQSSNASSDNTAAEAAAKKKAEAAAKKKAEAAAKKKAEAEADDLGLGLDTAGDTGTADLGLDTAGDAETGGAAESTGPTDDELRSELGL